MAISTYLENQLLNAALKNTAFTGPANVQITLCSTDTTDTALGTELTGSGFGGRQVLAFGTVANGAVTANTAVSFGPFTADTTVRSIALLDAATGGNVLFYQNISPRTVKDGDTIDIDQGDFTVKLD